MSSGDGGLAGRARQAFEIRGPKVPDKELFDPAVGRLERLSLGVAVRHGLSRDMWGDVFRLRRLIILRSVRRRKKG